MPKTLLLADDSVTIQKVVGLSFASEDVVLVTVSNGDDAVARARELRPDVILADVVMPGRNGYEVCEAIKTDPELRHVPVLLLTGTFEPFDQERARSAGADGHVTKPFEAQALVQQVKDLMARSDREAAPAVPAIPFEAPALSRREQSRSAADPVFEDELASAPDFGDAGLGLDADAAAGELELETVAEEEAADDLATSSRAAQTPAAEIFEVSQDSFRGTPIFAPAASETDGFSPRAAAPVPAGLPPEDDFDLGFDEPVFTATSPGETSSRLSPTPPASRFFEDDSAADTVLDSGHAGGYDLSFSDLDDPLSTARGQTPMEPDLASASDGATSTQPNLERLGRSRRDADATPATGLSVDLSPVLRQRLHDTLEKVAWEAFADISDTIVRHALERIETIAWEVIPQMAEQLIREEIRRMKDEGEDS